MNKAALEHSLEFIGSWLRLRYEREDIPGYVVAIAHKGQLVFDQAYGYADVERRIKLTPQHLFRIASHSKTFTATAIMQLQAAGKLHIDDRIVQYLPWLQEHKDKRWQNVTIRQLMSHSAGVVRDALERHYWQLEKPCPDEQEFRRQLLEADLVIEPNTKFKYSNFGYALLGLLFEAVAGEPYNDYVTGHIVKSLGLKNTGPEYTLAIKSRLVTGYTRRDVNKTRLPIAQIDTRTMSAAGGFYSTAEDLCHYFTAQMVGSGKLLDDESKEEMQRSQWHTYAPYQSNRHDYGLGIDIEFIGKHRTIGHGGALPGHVSKTMADPKDELVVVVMTNYIDSPASLMAKGIYEVLDYFQKNTPTTKPKHDLSRLEGRCMNLWAITDIVVTGDKVVAVYPNTWDVFPHPEELHYVDDTTLQVGKTSSFAAEGELVHFNIKNNRVASVNYTGSTMWPELVWLKQQSRKKIIGLSA